MLLIGSQRIMLSKKMLQFILLMPVKGFHWYCLTKNSMPAAEIEALNARSLFYKNNLSNSYIESTIALTIIYRKTEQVDQYLNLLREAEKLVKPDKLSNDYIIFYKYLAEMHFHQKNLNKAYSWQNKYSSALLAALLRNSKTIESNNLSTKHEIQKHLINKSMPTNNTSQELASSFSEKFRKQEILLVTSTAVTFVLLLYIIFLGFVKIKKS